ncbi:hypothetical protein AKJ58_01235 [candidate division MSBL1 archaeon SCGC-AAA385D11]|uniref:Uncharacterized protein n=1 Tax=candidate division MSBL1 archaeon SCGC-AAA385D11 TaxID=1698286 RepID=A0A133VNG2_9EURY|nr:hypothetical protein AKJ58_01235 [candidate division MSBL1 archaeon SCGC-AAA385D11]
MTPLAQKVGNHQVEGTQRDVSGRTDGQATDDEETGHSSTQIESEVQQLPVHFSGESGPMQKLFVLPLNPLGFQPQFLSRTFRGTGVGVFVASPRLGEADENSGPFPALFAYLRYLEISAFKYVSSDHELFAPMKITWF